MSELDSPKGLIIVTGASRGIGAATARSLAQRGHPILINYSRDTSSAEELVAEQSRLGFIVESVRADLATETGVLDLFAAADDLGIPLSGLVNNAGVTGGFSRVADLKDHVLRHVLAVNVAGCFLCAREAVRRMSRQCGGQGGSIVNISSIAAKLGGAGEWIHYAASKGALDTLTIGLAREVAGEGIRVNAVAAGLIETDLHAAAGAPDRLDRLAPGIPIGRAGTTDEVAAAVVWLMSSAASYVTGAILPVGGGR
ncbi:SDR family oxidoreductase [Microvirga pakistanensis]|uniref:SDR family oxidoreductase n=1 Tax=Microvirga pakistanensis TaxID=1682650 RepID=UPI00106CE486|nr:SDR family oxidoreductase [Microvirga pakistanensis]